MESLRERISIVYILRPLQVEQIPVISDIEYKSADLKVLKSLNYDDIVIVGGETLINSGQITALANKLTSCKATVLLFLDEKESALNVASYARLGLQNIYLSPADLLKGLQEKHSLPSEYSLLKQSEEQAGVFSFCFMPPDTVWLSTSARYFLGFDEQINSVEREAIVERIHPLDVDYIRSILSGIERTDSSALLEVRIANRFNKFQWMRLFINKMSRNNYVVGFVQNIEREKQLREKIINRTIGSIKTKEILRNIQKITGIGTWVCNVQSGRLNFSSQIKELFQTGGKDACHLTEFLRLVPLQDRRKFSEDVIGNSPNRNDMQIECKVETVKKQSLYVRIIIFKHKHKPSANHLLEGTLQNITDERMHEMELEAKNRQLEEFNRNIIKHTQAVEIAKKKAEENDQLKTAFISNLTHEIRTPLSTIGGFAELLQSETLNQEKRGRYLKQILQSNKQLLRIFSDVLDLSRINSNQLVLSKIATNVDHLVEELYFEYKAFVKNPSVELRLQRNGKNVICLIDAEKTRRTISALLDNALKFTEEGEITLSYSIRPQLLEITVSDTGVGIPQEKIEDLYEPFKQADSSLSRRFGGTGIGLSIVKALVDFMGGTVTIDSKPNVGTSVSLSIPLES